MAYNVTLRSKAVAGSVNIFDSAEVRWITGGVTLDHTTVPEVDGKKVLKAGQPLGRITATGKYGPYDPDATDGRQTAVVLLGEDVDFRLNNGSYGDQVATAFDWARVIEARLPVAVDATVKEQLKNITFV